MSRGARSWDSVVAWTLPNNPRMRLRVASRGDGSAAPSAASVFAGEVETCVDGCGLAQRPSSSWGRRRCAETFCAEATADHVHEIQTLHLQIPSYSPTAHAY